MRCDGSEVQQVTESLLVETFAVLELKVVVEELERRVRRHEQLPTLLEKEHSQ